MSFALWTMLGLIWIVGGLWDTTLREESAGTSPINEIVAGAEIQTVDDAGLGASDPLNATIGIFNAVVGPLTRSVQLMSFDYVFLQGPLQIIRIVLGVWASAMVLMAIRDYGPTLVGAIRSLNPFG